MSRSTTRVHADDIANDVHGVVIVADEPAAQPVHRPVDSSAVRWVFAATVAFWLAVYAVGRSFF